VNVAKSAWCRLGPVTYAVTVSRNGISARVRLTSCECIPGGGDRT
jgi:hypothetical protein